MTILLLICLIPIAIVYILSGIYLYCLYRQAPEGEEIPGIGFVRSKKP